MNREVIYLDDEDRERYLALLGQVVERYGWRCLAFCLMHNHVHVLVKTPEPCLGRGMQRLHGVYAQYFNRRHRRSGHPFQMCREAADWRWSSHPATIDGRPRWLDTPLLLGHIGADRGDPLGTYVEFVA